jgi:hypothetical protein
MRRSSSKKDRPFEQNKHICHEIGAVHFRMIWESVENIEPAGIPYDRIHTLFALNTVAGFCDYIISRQNPRATW